MATTGPQGSSGHAGEQARRQQAAGHGSQAEHSKPGNIVTAVTEKVQDVASGAKDTVEEWGSQVGQKAQDLARSTARTAENFGEELTTLIRRYPTQSLLLGIGIGFLLAQMRRS